MHHPVEIYTRLSCPFCQRAKELLHIKGIAFVEHCLDKDAGRAAEMIERGGINVPGIFIAERCIGSCSELFALDESGELDRLLTPMRG